MADVEAFERIAATIDSPMAIVTAGADGAPAGCLVGFSTQCSIDPVRYLVCLSRVNRSYRVAASARTLVVHVLHDSAHDRGLARLFGEETGTEVDKFDHCRWSPGPDGTPVLDGCDWFSGRIAGHVDLGDHVGFVLEVAEGVAERTSEPYLGFVQVRDLDAGNPA
jgi:flavin reductase (DIM6/NTAB) family NADH-FMN oxidoreductase RutF